MKSWINPPIIPRSRALSVVPSSSTVLRARASQTGISATINTSAELEAFLLGHGADGAVSEAAALRVAAVYASARLISGTVSTIPISVKRRIDHRTRIDASDHNLWHLLRRRPNRYMKPAAFRRLLQNNVLFRGNGYGLKVFNALGAVVEVWPLDPDRITPKLDERRNKFFEFRTEAGGVIKYSAREIFHVMGMTFDGITGVSVLSFARHAVALSIDAREHGRSVFSNGARPASAIETDNALSDPAIERLKISLAEHTGAENSNATMILEEGLKFKQVAMSNADAEFIKTREFSVTEIAMFFGVPTHMINAIFGSDSSGKNLEERGRSFVQFSLEDWLTAWEDAINCDLIDQDRDPDLFAKFNRNALVRGDMATREKFYKSMLQFGVYSPNEVRAFEDENPREGGDIYYPPPNLTAPEPEGGAQ